MYPTGPWLRIYTSNIAQKMSHFGKGTSLIRGVSCRNGDDIFKIFKKEKLQRIFYGAIQRNQNVVIIKTNTKAITVLNRHPAQPNGRPVMVSTGLTMTHGRSG